MAKTLKLRTKQYDNVKKLKSAVKKGGSGSSIRLARVPQDGSLTVRFLTEPETTGGVDGWTETWMHYDSTRDGDYNFPCAEDCEYCADNVGNDDAKPRKCYIANVLDVEEGKVVPLHMPMTLAGSVLKKYEKFKTILDRDYDLSREGTGFDTEYDCTPEAPRKMNLTRYNLIDINDMLLTMLVGSDDDETEDEEDEETPRKKSRGGVSRPARKPVEDDDEDDEDEEDEDEEDEAPRRTLTKKRVVARKPPLAKKTAPAKKIVAKKKAPLRRK